MFTYRQNSRVSYEIGVGEHDGDIRFLSGSRNKAVLRMRNEKYAICPMRSSVLQLLSGKLVHTRMQTSLPLSNCSTDDLMVKSWPLLHESCYEVVDVTDSRAVDHLLNVNISMTIALMFSKIGNFVLKSTDIHAVQMWYRKAGYILKIFKHVGRFTLWIFFRTTRCWISMQYL